jgi:acetylornithine deacetylase/succinyl-diaminopimelate desuccinylase-like protein
LPPPIINGQSKQEQKVSELDKILTAVDDNFDASLQRLFALLGIPSISTDPAYAKECRKAGQWLVDYLEKLGFDARLRETPGHPIVLAHYKSKAKGERKHLLFYGHYDVQPVDPLNLWNTDPFKPALATGPGGKKRIVARGAADDKGQLMTIVEAMAAQLKTTGDLPADVTLLFEGEEESGSANLEPFLQENAKNLRADIALVCDTDMWDEKTPAITASLRGMVGEEVTLTCASRDLHSGMYGGPAQNPIKVLVEILAKMHDEKGRVTLPGFYDGVGGIPDSVRKQWKNLRFDESDFLKDVGLSKSAGEQGFSVLEQIWVRPTLEFNGISGGYTGEGFKTVLPSKAHVKISCRLVGNQDPKFIRESLRKFIRDNLPVDCKVEFNAHGGSPGFQVPLEGEAIKRASEALANEWGQQTVLAGSGGSIPVVEAFKRILGMDSLLIGYGLDDDCIHSPNEKYELSSYHKGIRSWVRVLHALAQ